MQTFDDLFGAEDLDLSGVCRVCGCTADDCSDCYARTGAVCWWVEPDLCSACATPQQTLFLKELKEKISEAKASISFASQPLGQWPLISELQRRLIATEAQLGKVLGVLDELLTPPPEEDEDEEEEEPGEAPPPDLGPCCCCERTGPEVRNIFLLDKLSPILGRGWGCFVCGLPNNGASVVTCDSCLKNQVPYVCACVGYPGTDGRVPIGELKGEHRCDLSKHLEDLNARR